MYKVRSKSNAPLRLSTLRQMSDSAQSSLGGVIDMLKLFFPFRWLAASNFGLIDRIFFGFSVLALTVLTEQNNTWPRFNLMYAGASSFIMEF